MSSNKKQVLMLGVGTRDQPVWSPDSTNIKDFAITTLDINPKCQPDIVWDLNQRPLPFKDNQFDIVEAFEILEHIGRQGDVVGFFAEFHDYWRILKPDGLLVGSAPHDATWTFGDPGHTRVINEGTLTFSMKQAYIDQLGKTSMSDYRDLLGETNFELVQDKTYVTHDGGNFVFQLKAIK